MGFVGLVYYEFIVLHCEAMLDLTEFSYDSVHPA